MVHIRDNYEKTTLWKDHKFKGFLDRFQSYRPKEETGQDKFWLFCWHLLNQAINNNNYN